MPHNSAHGSWLNQVSFGRGKCRPARPRSWSYRCISLDLVGPTCILNFATSSQNTQISLKISWFPAKGVNRISTSTRSQAHNSWSKIIRDWIERRLVAPPRSLVRGEGTERWRGEGESISTDTRIYILRGVGDGWWPVTGDQIDVDDINISGVHTLITSPLRFVMVIFFVIHWSGYLPDRFRSLMFTSCSYLNSKFETVTIKYMWNDSV